MLLCRPAMAEGEDKKYFFNYVAQGHLHLDAGRSGDAAEAYQKALALFPDSPAVLFNLAIAYYMERDIDNAAATLKRLLKIEPDDPEALYNLGHILLLQKKTGEARETFLKAASIESCPQRFLELIQQGLALIGNLESLDPFSRDLAFFVIQNQAGLTPTPVAF